MTAKDKKTTKKTAAKKTDKAPRRTMAGVAYELIKAGKTNEEVRVALKKEFSLPEKHNYYPAWYRSHLVQKQVVTKEFAAKHSGEPEKPAKEKKAKAVKAAPKKASKKASEAGLATAGGFR